MHVTIGVDCGFLPIPANGNVAYINGDTLFESRVQYECDPGYTLQGASIGVCQADGAWSLTVPTCNRKS